MFFIRTRVRETIPDELPFGGHRTKAQAESNQNQETVGCHEITN